MNYFLALMFCFHVMHHANTEWRTLSLTTKVVSIVPFIPLFSFLNMVTVCAGTLLQLQSRTRRECQAKNNGVD